MSNVQAHRFRCLAPECHTEWEDTPGPATCPVCGHDYVRDLSCNQPVIRVDGTYLLTQLGEARAT